VVNKWGIVDNPLFFCYTPVIMKKLTQNPKEVLKKVRSRTNLDTFYTYSHWPSKEIDGITFVPVVKNLPGVQTQTLHYMRKDNLEYIR